MDHNIHETKKFDLETVAQVKKQTLKEEIKTNDDLSQNHERKGGENMLRDNLIGSSGNDTLVSGAGNDYMEGGKGSDTYIFSKGHGQDTILEEGSSSAGYDTIKFTDVALSEVVFQQDGDDLVISGYNDGDSVRIQKFFYHSYYEIEKFIFSDQSITLDDMKRNGMSIYGTSGNDNFNWTNGKVSYYAGDGDDVIKIGYYSNCLLDGGAGNDKLYAGYGNDTLIGGTGNDYMEGGKGNDTYIFSKGHGQDAILDIDGSDTIQFTDVALSEVVFWKDGNDLIISGYNDGDSVSIREYFSTNNFHNYEIDNFIFKDQAISLADLKKKIIFQGTNSNDNFNWTGGKVVLYAGDGDDNIITGAYDDLLDGGAGNDKLYAGYGNDTLIGGTGNDYMEGGYGNDTYIFSKGHGQDIILEVEGSDTIQFTDVALSEVIFQKDNDDLIISGYNNGDSVRIQKFFYYSSYEIDNFIFKDQSVKLVDLKKNGIPLYGTNEDDTFTWSGGRVLFYAGDGDDVIKGGNSDDLLDGGDGDDRLYAGYGNDILIGGNGNDYMEGGEGGDTYVFSKGHGRDIIYDQAKYSSEENNSDTIQFTDVALSEVTFWRDGDDLIISGYNDGDSVRIREFISNNTYYNYNIENFIFKDQSVTLADLKKNGMTFQGSNDDDTFTWTDSKALVYAGDGDDNISTGTYDDLLDGGDGNDKLYGGGGNDTLIGGTGNDYMEGGSGNDTYVFSKGHGQDTILEQGNSYISYDTIKFTDVALSEVDFRQVGDDLVISGYSNGDSVRIQKFFAGNAYEIDNFIFKDQSISLDDMKKNGITIYGTSGNDSFSWSGSKVLFHAGDGDDSITTGAYDDLLDGGNGNDKLYGGTGNDTLIGGAGNDYMEGGRGKDTYVFSKGHGQDTILEEGGTDTIQFTDVALSEVEFWKNGSDLIISGYNDGDSVRIQKFFYNNNYNNNNYEIENFIFKDQSITFADLKKNGMTFKGTGGNDYFTWTDGKALVYAGNGDDVIKTGAYDDLLDGGAGNDKLYAGDGNDTLIGGTGNDYMEGGKGNDTYIFSKGHGQDTILEFGSSAGGSDTIRFTDVALSEATFQKDGDDLVISGYSDGDSVRIQKFFTNSFYEIENFIFKDHSVTITDLKQNGKSYKFSNDMDSLTRSDKEPQLYDNDIITTCNYDNLIGSNFSDDHMNGNTDMTRQMDIEDQTSISNQLNNSVSSQLTSNTEIHYAVASQLQQLISAMAAFTASTNDAQVIPEEIKQFTQQNNLAAYWGN